MAATVIGAGLALVVIGAGLALVRQPAGAVVPPGVPAVVVEAPHCREGTDTPEVAPAEAAVGQAVTVSVPRTAIVDVDHRGRVLWAATNTGCRPRPGDDLYVRRPDGTIAPAPSTAFAGVAWRGDFTRGLADRSRRAAPATADPT